MSKESAGGKWDIEGCRRGGGGLEAMQCDGVCLGEFNLTSSGGRGSESKTCKSLTRETVFESMPLIYDLITRTMTPPDRL